MDSVLLKNGLDMCALICNVLKNEITDTAGMDLERIYNLSRGQALSAVTCMALEQSGALKNVEPQLAARWRQERDMSVRRNLLFSTERAEILELLEQEGIWYMPLKGSVLADQYPRAGMRQMADNDILFDKSRREDVKRIMLERDYEIDMYGSDCHDVYQKEPIYNFEMHTALFSDDSGPVLVDYYKNIHEKLISDGGQKRRFTPEDFYLYFLAHGYKHFVHSGNGIRFLMDCHVILTRQENMDWEYLARELRKLELTAFEEQIRTLSRKLFGKEETLTAAETQSFLYCLRSNTYGTMDHAVSNKLRQLQPDGDISLATRIRYCFLRLWPDNVFFPAQHPVMSRHWILKLCYAVFRFFRVIFTQWKKLLRELGLVFLGKEERGDDHDC